MCAQSGVHEIRIGELHLIFGEKDLSPTNSLRLVQTKPREQESQKIIAEASAEEKKRIAEEYIEELRLTDPLAFEQTIGGDLDVGSTT